LETPEPRARCPQYTRGLLCNDEDLLGATAWLIPRGIDAHVLYIPGASDEVTVPLPFFDNALALHSVPNIEPGLFQPPRGSLGASKK
jgi:hypothetical protein